jgi:hypothetical protein
VLASWPIGRAAWCWSPVPRQRQVHHLAAMIDRINLAKKHHILTIEDPIEYLHQHKTAW